MLRKSSRWQGDRDPTPQLLQKRGIAGDLIDHQARPGGRSNEKEAAVHNDFGPMAVFMLEEDPIERICFDVISRNSGS